MVLKRRPSAAVTVALRASIAWTAARSVATGNIKRRHCLPSVVSSTVPPRPTTQHTVPPGAAPAIRSASTPVGRDSHVVPASVENSTEPAGPIRQRNAVPGEAIVTCALDRHGPLQWFEAASLGRGGAGARLERRVPALTPRHDQRRQAPPVAAPVRPLAQGSPVHRVSAQLQAVGVRVAQHPAAPRARSAAAPFRAARSVRLRHSAVRTDAERRDIGSSPGGAALLSRDSRELPLCFSLRDSGLTGGRRLRCSGGRMNSSRGTTTQIASAVAVAATGTSQRALRARRHHGSGPTPSGSCERAPQVWPDTHCNRPHVPEPQ